MVTIPVALRGRGAAALLLPFAIAGLVVLTAARSTAFEPDSGRRRLRASEIRSERSTFGSDFDDDFGLTILQMQREAISSAEEQAREAGRTIRREEVEQQKKQQAEEHDQYFQSVLEASQASLRAPRGVYYRKPGEVAQEAPASAQQVEVGGVTFLYDQGVFWLTPGPPFLVVTAPYGAVVDKLPVGAYRMLGKDAPQYYHFGVFYREKDGKFEVVKPPVGTLVSYLPDGYRTEQEQGKAIYLFGSTRFKPVFVQGVLVYQVAEP